MGLPSASPSLFTFVRFLRSNRRARFRLHATPAFSLLEVLIALALMGLLAALFVVSIPGIMDGLGTRPLPEILQKAVRDARFQAASRKELVTLRFDDELGAFVVLDGAGNMIAERESGYGADNAQVEVQFYQILPYEGVDSVSRQADEVKINEVRFHPDRSSTPFVAELDVEGERSRHRFDPFSDLEVEDE